MQEQETAELETEDKGNMFITVQNSIMTEDDRSAFFTAQAGCLKEEGRVCAQRTTGEPDE